MNSVDCRENSTVARALKQERPRLLAFARRRMQNAAEADDIVQTALLAALEAGRIDLTDTTNARWLRGVIVNMAAMWARGAKRRRVRERAWQESRENALVEPPSPPERQASLSPSLAVTARLITLGCTRAELRSLLAISDTALRQRIHAIRSGVASPRRAPLKQVVATTIAELAPARVGVRPALLVSARRVSHARLASHDPDGHLFVVTRSQERPSRQL